MSIAVPKSSISVEAASILLDAADKAAREINVPMVIAVVDESGILKAFRRMDGAALLSVDIALDKAYTAVSFRKPSHAIYDFIKGDAVLLHGMPQVPRVMAVGGGFPIVVQDKMVGGIGISGGHYTQDMKVAETALSMLQENP